MKLFFLTLFLFYTSLSFSAGAGLSIFLMPTIVVSGYSTYAGISSSTTELTMWVQEKFFSENKEKIALDIARGDGEYIKKYLELLNINDFDVKILKENFEVIFPSSDVSSYYVHETINEIYEYYK